MKKRLTVKNCSESLESDTESADFGDDSDTQIDLSSNAGALQSAYNKYPNNTRPMYGKNGWIN